MAETCTVQQIWEACVCIAEAHGVWGFPPTQCRQGFQSEFRCAQLIGNARSCAELRAIAVLELHAIVRNCAELRGVYRARNCTRVQSTCVGNPAEQFSNLSHGCMALMRVWRSPPTGANLKPQINKNNRCCLFKIYKYFIHNNPKAESQRS